MEKESLDSSTRSFVPDNLIRTLAITLVILLHAANSTLQASSVPETYWWTAVVYKSLALPCVPLFVMLSGALLRIIQKVFPQTARHFVERDE